MRASAAARSGSWAPSPGVSGTSERVAIASGMLLYVVRNPVDYGAKTSLTEPIVSSLRWLGDVGARAALGAVAVAAWLEPTIRRRAGHLTPEEMDAIFE